MIKEPSWMEGMETDLGNVCSYVGGKKEWKTMGRCSKIEKLYSSYINGVYVDGGSV
jgi:hypothetical protein